MFSMDSSCDETAMRGAFVSSADRRMGRRYPNISWRRDPGATAQRGARPTRHGAAVSRSASSMCGPAMADLHAAGRASGTLSIMPATKKDGRHKAGQESGEMVRYGRNSVQLPR